MKKVFLLVASAMLTTGAFAQMGFLSGIGGTSADALKWSGGNQYTGTVGESGAINPSTCEWLTAEPAANQEFTFAIKVTDPILLSWLGGEAGRTLALADFRSGVAESTNKSPIRLIKMPGTNTYAIKMVIKQIFYSINFTGVDFDTDADAATPGIQNNNRHIHFQLTAAYANNATKPDGSHWCYDSFGYGSFDIVAPTGTDAPALDWPEDLAPADNYDKVGGPNASGIAMATLGCGTGIGDITANGKTIVGYYSILGVQLKEEPASGIFVEKYSDGTSAKIVK